MTRQAPRLIAVVAVALALVTIDLSVAEFVDVQRMTDAEIRARFHFPASCRPRIAALRGRGTKITAVIHCAAQDRPAGDAAAASFDAPGPR